MKALLEFVIGAAIAGFAILAAVVGMGGRMDW
jgi:hypothetical protein